MSCFNPLAEGNLKEGELIQQTQQLDLGVSQSVDSLSPSISLHQPPSPERPLAPAPACCRIPPAEGAADQQLGGEATLACWRGVFIPSSLTR